MWANGHLIYIKKSFEINSIRLLFDNDENVQYEKFMKEKHDLRRQFQAYIELVLTRVLSFLSIKITKFNTLESFTVNLLDSKEYDFLY